MNQIGRYEVVGRIAVGDSKELMLGREPSGRPVAIKRIPRGAGHGSTARHPNLVETIEIVQIDDDFFLVMEYLEGENLAGLIRRLIKRRERIAYGLAAHIIAEICDGLHAAHMAGELHRAVSPENIFITYGGDVKLLDLGIALIDADSPYRSPEQASARPLGRQSDVYSLGLVLYELTTLRRLFANAADEREVPRPTTQVNDYPAELEPITLHAIEPEAAHRFRSAAEMHDALLGCARALGTDDDPSQSLASKLMRLFGDRLAMKRELLDRLRVGMPLGDLVPTDVDEEIEVPLVMRPSDASTDKNPVVMLGDDEVKTDPATSGRKSKIPITKPRGSPDPRLLSQPAPPPPAQSSRSSGSAPSLSGPSPSGSGPLGPSGFGSGSAPSGFGSGSGPGGFGAGSGPGTSMSSRRASESLQMVSGPVSEQLPAPTVVRGSFRWGVALLVLLAIGAGGAGGWWLRLRDGSSATPSAPARAPADARAPDARSPDAAPRLPDLVTITIESDPPGAKVIVDGEERGSAPVDLKIKGALNPVAVELRRDGFKPTKVDVIPDRDRTVHEKLAP